jgi:hypothetical protein
MAQDLRRLADYLVELGVEKVPHTKKSYLAHLIGVYRFMEAQGCSEELCAAGMFHSIYGTERFAEFSLNLERREEVRELIGQRAERLAYLNCAMDRASFDRVVGQPQGPYRIRDRISGAEVELNEKDFNDLCRIHLYDWLEQVPRSREWGYRRNAYRQMVDRSGEEAQRAYDRVFAQEKVGV